LDLRFVVGRREAAFAALLVDQISGAVATVARAIEVEYHAAECAADVADSHQPEIAC